MMFETPAPLRALLDRDAAVLASLYTSYAVFVPVDAPIATGTESIKPIYEGLFDQFASAQTVSVDECLISGDWPSPEAPGNWMILHAIQPDGSWKIARHMWNAPPARAV